MRSDQQLNVSFLDGKIFGMAGDQGCEFGESLGELVARDVEIAKHPIAGRNVGHLSLGINQDLFRLIRLTLRKVKAGKCRARRRVFRFRLNCRFELLVGIFKAFLTLVESSKVHSGRNGCRLGRLCFLEIRFGFGVISKPLLQKRKVEING